LPEKASLLENIGSAYQFSCFKDKNVQALITGAKNLISNYNSARLNCDSLLPRFGIDFKDLFFLNQIHSASVVCIKKNEPFLKERFKADALITNVKDIAIAIFIADCLAIYFFDPERNVIALAHAGWRGTSQQISSIVVKAMANYFGSQPKDLIVGFSPAIRNCCYEVDRKVADLFKLGVIKRKNKLFLNLAKCNKNELLRIGVRRRNIFDSKVCTACQGEDEFFSYRRQGKDSGRMMALFKLT